MKYKIGDIVRYQDDNTVRIGAITYVSSDSRIHFPYVIQGGHNPSYCESADCTYKRHIIDRVVEQDKELNSYNQIVSKINNLLLNGEKILEEIYADDNKVYSIDKIAVHQIDEILEEKLKYTITFDQDSFNKDLESPYSKAVYHYLETKYEDSPDRRKAKEKTKLLNDFELYINDISCE